jgi:hypothetical protein
MLFAVRGRGHDRVVRHIRRINQVMSRQRKIVWCILGLDRRSEVTMEALRRRGRHLSERGTTVLRFASCNESPFGGVRLQVGSAPSSELHKSKADGLASTAVFGRR